MTAHALILSSHDGIGDLRRWCLAAAMVVTAHVGLAASYALWDSSEPDGAEASPAVIVELAPMPVAPTSQLDLAPGPEMVEAQAAPKPPPQTKPEVAEPIEKIEAPAEVTLPLPEPKAAEEKSEQQPDTQKTDAKPVEQNVPAPRTTAAPRSEQNTAAQPVAPSPGSSAASRAAIARWRDLVAARLQQNKRYPANAEAQHEQGVVMLSFSVDRNGRMLSRRIARSSGHSSLDQEVLAMVERAQPLPSFPPAMTQASINLTVPIRFSLR